jgi:two-component system, chemotaxis family, protein-glutamate methylesterase/glutaminase
MDGVPHPGPAASGANRDVIVVGASAGGVEATRQLLAGLPAGLPAAVFVVIHRGLREPNLLPEVLAAASAIPVATAEEGQRFERGRAYVAPADRHLLVGRDHVHVRRGPHENRWRPAVDPLFRSAAASCTTRVIGVVLSGLLDDGSSGLRAVRQCGGLAVVQDPRDATFGDMPRNAIAHAAPEHVVPLRGMGGLLARLAAGPRPPPVEVPDKVRLEALVPALEVGDVSEKLGSLSPLTCPECHGSVYEIREGGLIRYRCHTGHAFTLEALRACQAEGLERALYSAMRAQEEQAILTRRVAEEMDRRGDMRSAAELERRAEGYKEGADALRRMLAAATGNGG